MPPKFNEKMALHGLEIPAFLPNLRHEDVFFGTSRAFPPAAEAR